MWSKSTGRARMASKAVNRVQYGLKVPGIHPSTYRHHATHNAIHRRVQENIRVGCVNPKTQLLTGRVKHVNKQNIVECRANTMGWLLRPQAPASRGMAGRAYFLYNAKRR